MRLGDSATQRNLRDQGRRQAIKIGEALRADGVRSPKVLTSQWERCRETAELLGFGDPIETKGLNSFWERSETRGAVLAEFTELANGLPEGSVPVIFVTHYVNIQAVTGRAVGSGEGFWMPLETLQKSLAQSLTWR